MSDQRPSGLPSAITVAGPGQAERASQATIVLRPGEPGTEHIAPGQQPAFAPPRAPSDPPADLAGYRLGRKLGAGGMGAVYAAVDPAAGTAVALKVLRPDLIAAGAEFVARFQREAAAMAEVDDPHLVRLLGSGEDRGWLWLAMEYLPDGDLGSYLKRRGQLMERDAIRFAMQCGRGLIALHARGMVHRDFKPENVFLDQGRGKGEPIAKVGDLGLARHASGEDRMTMTGTACGTPAFMAPEQIRGDGDLDHRVDVYALGASLYKLVTGQDPFTGTTVFMLTSAVLKEPPPDPRRANPTVSAGLVGIIHKAMAKDRRERYRDVAEMVDDLGRLSAGKLLANTAPSPASLIFNEVAGGAAPPPVRSAGPAEGWDLGSFAPLIRLGIPAALVCTGLTVMVWMMGGDHGQAERPEGAPAASARAELLRDAFGPALRVPVAGRDLILRWCPPGAFDRGSADGLRWERPQRVALTKGVWILDVEISRSLFAAVMGDPPPQGTEAGMAQGDVTHDQALRFCERLNALVPGLGARLPSEAEFERACRIGGQAGPAAPMRPAVAAAWSGRTLADARMPIEVEDVWRLAADQSAFQPGPVGGGEPNAIGLWNLLGNQQEWCLDLWDGQSAYAEQEERDPVGEGGDLAVVRGGSWMHPPERCTPFARAAQRLDQATPWTGFRIAVAGGIQPELPAGLSGPGSAAPAAQP